MFICMCGTAANSKKQSVSQTLNNSDSNNVKCLVFFLQFFLRADDVGKNRAQVSLPRISELNSYVRMSVHTEKLTENFLGQFQVSIFM